MMGGGGWGDTSNVRSLPECIIYTKEYHRYHEHSIGRVSPIEIVTILQNIYKNSDG